MDLWHLFTLGDADLQRLWNLVYALHPHKEMVEIVLKEAYIEAGRLQATQHHNPGGVTFYKLRTPPECLLQLGVYLASTRWERDQESATPRKSPRYHPTHDDWLFRYIKMLIMETMLWRSEYGAVGLGCYLFTYSPRDIERLFDAFYNPANLRHYKQVMLERLTTRFAGLPTVRGKRGVVQVATRPPQEAERVAVRDALLTLRPWFPDARTHISAPQGSLSVLARYFGYTASRAEIHDWWRVHALIDPECAGLAQLVWEYNVHHNHQKLDEAASRLGIPLFPAVPRPDDPTDPTGCAPHVPPAPLTPQALRDLRHHLGETLRYDQQRLQAYEAGDLTVYVNGAVYGQIHGGSGASEAFKIPKTTSYLEIYGQDPAGELLLAVVPLPASAPHDTSPAFPLVIHPLGGLTLELTFPPVLPDPEGMREVRLRLRNAERRLSTLSALSSRPPLRSGLWQHLEGWLSGSRPGLVPALQTATATPPQTQRFELPNGKIQLTYECWTPQPAAPGLLRITWQAQAVPHPIEFWVRFTASEDSEDPALLLAEVRLGGLMAGTKVFTADFLGFDPARQRWDVALRLREPAS